MKRELTINDLMQRYYLHEITARTLLETGVIVGAEHNGTWTTTQKQVNAYLRSLKERIAQGDGRRALRRSLQSLEEAERTLIDVSIRVLEMYGDRPYIAPWQQRINALLDTMHTLTQDMEAMYADIEEEIASRREQSPPS